MLFADVVRSMELAARLDSERLREVLGELFSRCGAIVRRYGGTVDKFTGDGIMALFGAPIALEDHAVRACLAALEIQKEAEHLAGEVRRRDGVGYALQVGLNSGDVVAGQIGSGSANYTVIGEHVGIAQRMESAAPAGGVMITEATARLVGHTAILSDLQLVAAKGAAAPVPARLLLAVGARRTSPDRRASVLIGRVREIASIAELLMDVPHGGVVVAAVVGPAGIGKSRVALELKSVAESQGIQTFSASCESHTRDLPFHLIARLLRELFGVAELESAAARSKVRSQLPEADPDDVNLLEELLGIRDAAIEVTVAADGRRRRLSRLLASALSIQRVPTVFIIEDLHWIDDISEAILAEFLAGRPPTPALALITYRPEYDGAMRHAPTAVRFVLAPLDHSQSTSLATTLLGTNPSVAHLTEQVVARADGNPFFVHEIVRDLVEREILVGLPGAYEHHGEPIAVSVPPTLQAAIAARIDRLMVPTKRFLYAAAVTGSRFTTDLVTAVLPEPLSSVDAALTELLHAELIDEVTSSSAEYAFAHPLIRAVSIDSQLKSARAQVHRRLATVIEQQSNHGDENAMLIATHLEAADDLRDAFAWYMRAGTWFTNRDIGAARSSWRKAVQVADRLPTDAPDRTSMRIAPRSLLCGSTWRAGGTVADAGFEELRELCTDPASKIPLAMGMAGLMSALSVHMRIREALGLADEYVCLLESIGDPEFTVGLLYAAIHPNYLAGRSGEVLGLTQRVIDLADGDPTRGNFLTGSPLAFATTMRGIALCFLGRQGWRADLNRAIAMALQVDPTTYVSTVMFKYAVGIAVGALLPDSNALSETGRALDTALQCSEDFALGLAQVARGIVLTNIGSEDDRAAGLGLLASARELATQERFTMTEVPIIDVEMAAGLARAGDLDAAIDITRRVVTDLLDNGGALYLGAATTGLVTALLQRGGSDDEAEARAAVDALASATPDPALVLYELPVLRLRALLARDDARAYRNLADRYRARATTLGFEGHVAIAVGMQ